MFPLQQLNVVADSKLYADDAIFFYFKSSWNVGKTESSIQLADMQWR